MGPFSSRERCPASPELIEIEDARSGKIHVMEENHYRVLSARLERIIKARERRVTGSEPEPLKQERFPRAMILFRAIEAKWSTRGLQRPTSSPAVRTSQPVRQPR